MIRGPIQKQEDNSSQVQGPRTTRHAKSHGPMGVVGHVHLWLHISYYGRTHWEVDPLGLIMFSGGPNQTLLEYLLVVQRNASCYQADYNVGSGKMPSRGHLSEKAWTPF